MKKWICLMVILALTLSAVGAAGEEMPAEAAKITLLVREKLGISEEYDRFSSDYSYSGDDMRVWNLYWQGNIRGVSVSCSDDGVVYSYYRYEEGEYDSSSDYAPRMPAHDLAEAREAMEQFFRKTAREDEDITLKGGYAAYINDSLPSYLFQGYITRGGVATDTGFNMRLWAEDLSVRSYDRDDGYLHFNARGGTEPALTKEEAAAALRSAYDVQLRYISESPEDMRLAYVMTPDKGKAVDALTGEVLEYTEGWYYGEQDAGEGEYVSAKAALTPAEQEGVEKLRGVHTQEELDAVVRSMIELGVTDDFRLMSASFSTSGDQVTASLSYETQNDDYKYITVDARELTLVAEYTGRYYGREFADYSPDRDKAREKAEAFVEKYFPRLSGHYTFSETMVLNPTWQPVVAVVFARMENGVRYDGNTIRIEVNTEMDLIDSVDVYWTETASFPSPEGVADIDAARETYFALAEPELRLCRFFSDEEGAWKEKLCYVLSTAGIVRGLDAFTLEPIENGKGREAQPLAYEDTEDVTEAAKALAAFGAGLPGGRFDGSKGATLRDALTLILSAGGRADVGETDGELVQRAQWAGALAKGEEYDLDAEVSRIWMARTLMQMSGYGKAAMVPGIYVCGFADDGDIPAEDFGYIAIAKGMGVAQANGDGRFEPARIITRAEAAQMVYAFLTREY